MNLVDTFVLYVCNDVSTFVDFVSTLNDDKPVLLLIEYKLRIFNRNRGLIKVLNNKHDREKQVKVIITNKSYIVIQKVQK